MVGPDRSIPDRMPLGAASTATGSNCLSTAHVEHMNEPHDAWPGTIKRLFRVKENQCSHYCSADKIWMGPIFYLEGTVYLLLRLT